MTLREMREARGLTQEDVARELNRSKSTVSLYECGKASPRAKVLPRYAELLEVTVDELLRAAAQAEAAAEAI